MSIRRFLHMIPVGSFPPFSARMASLTDGKRSRLSSHWALASSYMPAAARPSMYASLTLNVSMSSRSSVRA